MLSIVLILIILEVLYEYSLLESICKMYETVLILIILEVLYESKMAREERVNEQS